MRELPVAEIMARYEARESTRELGRAYRVGRMTIWRRLVAAGVKMRAGGGPQGNGNGNHKLGGPLHLDAQSYLITRDRESKGCKVHRACWEAYFGPIPEDYDIHHIDEDRLHNAIENLTCMPHGAHSRLHRRKDR